MRVANAAYYGRGDVFGAQGDFITAPEISQMFGELVGLWLADIWLRWGKPGPAYYVELGPGRGTLAADALRALPTLLLGAVGDRSKESLLHATLGTRSLPPSVVWVPAPAVKLPGDALAQLQAWQRQLAGAR